jgi:hypothetical protein
MRRHRESEGTELILQGAVVIRVGKVSEVRKYHLWVHKMGRKVPALIINLLLRLRSYHAMSTA